MGPRGRRRAGARRRTSPARRCGSWSRGRSSSVVRTGGAADGVVRRAVTTPGYPVGWDGMVWPGRHRWDAVAASPARLLRVPRGVIDARGGAGRRLRGPVLPVPAVAGGGPVAWAAHPPRHRPLRRRDRRGRRAHRVPRGRAARDLRAAPHPRLPAFAPDRRRRFPGAGGAPRRRGRPGGRARARGARPARGRTSRTAGVPGPAAGVRGGRRGVCGRRIRGAAGPLVPSADRPVRAHRVPHCGPRPVAHRDGQHRAQQPPG